MLLARAVLTGEPTAPVHSDSIDKQPFGAARAGVEMGAGLVCSVSSQEHISDHRSLGNSIKEHSGELLADLAK